MNQLFQRAAIGIALLAVTGFAQTSVDLSGTVTDNMGAPIESALVAIAYEDLYDFTDAAGHYDLVGTLPVLHAAPTQALTPYQVRAGSIILNLSATSRVKVELYTLLGSRLHIAFEGQLSQGRHTLPLGAIEGHTMLLLKTTINGKERVSRYLPMATNDFASPTAEPTTATPASLSKALAVDTARASAPGYISEATAIGAYFGTVNFTLQKLSSVDTSADEGVGLPGWLDGSYDRFAAYGMEQYFYGDWGYGDLPLVQVLSAVSTNSVDAMLTFNPGFTDNTYGSTVIGWNNHPFRHVYGSDHIELQMVNGDGQTVLHVKLDLVSACADAVSGWCSWGVSGEDGEVISGDASKIISFSTSMDDNLNWIDCPEYTVDSPPTDSLYTPSAECPNWQYYASYRISVDPSIFGPSGYGGVYMTSVHASPSKSPTDIETVPVTEGPPPSSDPLSPDNPWRFFTPYTNTPVPTVPDTTDSIPITD